MLTKIDLLLMISLGGLCGMLFGHRNYAFIAMVTYLALSLALNYFKPF